MLSNQTPMSNENVARTNPQPQKNDGVWDASYQASSSNELHNIYEKWVNSYDKDVREMGYVGPYVAAHRLAQYQPDVNAKILDIGCGTGLVGEELFRMGYKKLHGLDLSEGMLAACKDKNVYEELICMDLEKLLHTRAGHYDSALCIGAFTHGHLRATAIDPALTFVKPGGIFCFSVHEDVFESYGFKDKIKELQDNGRWTVQHSELEPYLIKKGKGAWLTVCKIND